MDLQWRRQVELWQHLLGHTTSVVGRKTEPDAGGDRLQLEALQGRALMTLSRPLAHNFLALALRRLLMFLLPEASEGLPMRAWVGQDQLWLAVTMPADSQAEAWYAMSQRLKLLLDRATKDGHGVG